MAVLELQVLLAVQLFNTLVAAAVVSSVKQQVLAVLAAAHLELILDQAQMQQQILVVAGAAHLVVAQAAQAVMAS